MSRRRFLSVTGAAVAAGCTASSIPLAEGNDPVHITARPGHALTTAPAGEHRLALGGARDGFLWVPSRVAPGQGAPLLVMLHGAGGRADRLRTSTALASDLGIAVLAPDSRGPTWDAIRGRFGPDVAFINAALQFTFERLDVNPRRLGVGGFSDGASYALALAIANGDVFTHALAFSPGFIPPGPHRGKPRIFISHGTQDDILPVEQTSQVIVPELEQRGYDVRYREFGGPHGVPPGIAREAFRWFLG